jgi:hypothetical protein
MCTCAAQVREVRGRLLSYWRRKVLVEAALEVFTPVVARSGPPHLRAALGNQVWTARLLLLLLQAAWCVLTPGRGLCMGVSRGDAQEVAAC